MSINEIKTELEALPADERRQLAAFLVSLHHRDIAGYRSRLTRKIDDRTPENWVSLEEMERRLDSTPE